MPNEMQKDLVLQPNEYAYLLDRTKGIINCYCGPTKTSLSNTDAPVRFDSKSKKFDECSLEEAIHLFKTAPENWYCVLKNPAPEGGHPIPRSVNELPQLEIGRKVNIPGPVSFALYPGQMAKVVQGHRLRSNQYLIIRVYDDKSATENWDNSIIKTAEATPTAGDNTDPEVTSETAATITTVSADKLFVGKLMVIKGTEVSFYIPPTGIEVVPTDADEYVRDAVTLERLEYCILKDENGIKRYVHGPAVVFPEPTESFVPSADGYKFRAIELSEISGIYVKVIAEYTEGTKHYNVGDELFITGKDQMIYYPRPEHAIVSYTNRGPIHHAVAIPAGEGRYVMDRLSGDISTIRGPKMFLPDPRTQVIVKRKLTRNQATLWYPGNDEVLEYNERLGSPEQQLLEDAITRPFASDAARVKSFASFEPGAYLNRSDKFTPPRTITIDNKFEGAVSIDVWTGYAINVISKDGKRKVIVGPCTYLMGYDETLEVLQMSTGKPKTTDRLLQTTFLRIDNNKIGDIFTVETKDFVKVKIKVSYSVNFSRADKDRWFSVENYVKYLCDRIRSLMKREAKRHTIEDFYQNSSDIVRRIVLNQPDPNEELMCESDGLNGRYFSENGMEIFDVEVLDVEVDDSVRRILNDHQYDTIRNTIELSDASQREDMARRLAASESIIAQIQHDAKAKAIDLQMALDQKRSAQFMASTKLDAAAEAADLKFKRDRQAALDEISKAEIARREAEQKSEIDYETKMANVEKFRRDAYAEAVKTMLEGISPELTSSIKMLAESEFLADVAESLSPLAIVNGTSIADTASKLLEGTALQGLLEKFAALPAAPKSED